MASGSAMFSFLIRATAPGQTKYVAGRRYELMMFVRHISLDEAKSVVRNVLSRLGWEFPEVVEAVQMDGKMTLKKLKNLTLEDAIRAAAKQGHSIVVFE